VISVVHVLIIDSVFVILIILTVLTNVLYTIYLHNIFVAYNKCICSCYCLLHYSY